MSGPLRLLLVDDEPAVTAGLERAFRSLRPQWQVQAVSSAMDAIEVMKRQPFDALVTDLAMPEVDGLSLLEWARRHTPDTRRVVVSGILDGRALIDVATLADAHLVKPVRTDDLVARIDALFPPPPLRIHLVDDSPHDRAVLTRLLTQALPTATIVPFGDGADYLNALAHQDRSDLLILDLAMPLMSGMEVLRWLHERGTRSFPILVISSQSFDLEMEMCRRLGADASLYKPSSYAEYGLIVEVAVGMLRHRGLVA